jgi:hypothetical protein
MTSLGYIAKSYPKTKKANLYVEGSQQVGDTEICISNSEQILHHISEDISDQLSCGAA